MRDRIVVTGGAGYIGSHVCVELLQAGYDVTVVDNLSTGSAAALARIQTISGRPLGFVHADLRDERRVERAFAQSRVDAVVHLAAMKSPLESQRLPLEYYDCNVSGALSLIRVMARHSVRRLVFSSTAAVYGDARRLPVTEASPCLPTHPYGRSKLMLEEILRDVAQSDPRWKIVALRYFNPIGAHSTGDLGEAPVGIPNNLAPYVLQVASGTRSHVDVFGTDYPTTDGSGVRDFIHVVDLAQAHVAALRPRIDTAGFRPVNVGTGQGVSVLACIKAAERATGRAIPFRVAARRPGDIVESYADVSLAAEVLGWRAQRSLDDMWRDAWRWETKNRSAEIVGQPLARVVALTPVGSATAEAIAAHACSMDLIGSELRRRGIEFTSHVLGGGAAAAPTQGPPLATHEQSLGLADLLLEGYQAALTSSPAPDIVIRLDCNPRDPLAIPALVSAFLERPSLQVLVALPVGSDDEPRDPSFAEEARVTATMLASLRSGDGALTDPHFRRLAELAPQAYRVEALRRVVEGLVTAAGVAVATEPEPRSLDIAALRASAALFGSRFDVTSLERLGTDGC